MPRKISLPFGSALSNSTGFFRGLPGSQPVGPAHVPTSGLPESYADLVAANPYLNYEYQPSIWDRIGNFVGFRTREDKYREEMQQASREYEAQLVSMNREEQYNSPVQQAARQRAAGINPDLNGVQPDSAAEFSEPETRPVPPEGGESLQFVGNMFSAMTTLMGLAQGWTNLRGSIIDNDLKDAAFVGELFNIGRGAFLNQLTPDQVKDFYSGQFGPENGEDFVVNAIAKGIDTDLFHSKKSAQRFFSAMNSAGRSIIGRKEAYTALSEGEDARGAFSRTKGSSRWSDDDAELEKILGMFGDAAYDVMEAEFKARKSSSDVMSRRAEADLSNGIPELESEAYGEELEGQKESLKVSNEVNGALRKLVHQLHEEAQSGSFLANAGLMLLGILPHLLGGAKSLLGMRGQMAGIHASEASAGASDASAALNRAKRYRMLGF